MKRSKIIHKLPKGWLKITLGEIILLEYGVALPQRIRVVGGKYPVYGSNGKVGNHNDYMIEGPVIIVGRKGSVGAVHYEKEKCWLIDTTYYIKCVNSLDSKFVFYLLKQLDLGKLDKSTAIPGINRNNVYEQSVWMPPLKEQHRIVEKIEELFSESDHAEEELKKAQGQLEIYIQSLLKDAFEDSIRVRGEFTYETLENVVTFIDYRGRTPKKTNKGVLLITAKNVKNGYLEREPQEYISEDDYEGWMTRGFPKKGDVLITTEAPLGHVAQLDIDEKIALAQRIITLQPKEMLISKFLKYILMSPQFQMKLLSKATGTTVDGIKASVLKKLEIPIPSILKQEYIVQEIETKFSLIENLKNTIKINLLKIEDFRCLVLEKAFKGDLVDQNLDDEDASKLLQKIQKEKDDYLNAQKEIQNKKPKVRLIMKGNKSIREILKEIDSPIEAEQLWLQSKHAKDIDAFYAELKEIESKNLINIVLEGKYSMIGLKK